MPRLPLLSTTTPRPALRSAVALLLQAVVLTGGLSLPARAEADAMMGADMTCATFSAMDATGQMQAMDAMAAQGTAGGAMATHGNATGAMASGAMATDAAASGAMADTGMMASHDDLMATVDACAGHADMMAVDAMHQAVSH